MVYPPIREWIFLYDVSEDLVYDTIAGVTVGIMAVPQSLSYALIAGLPPQYGLYSDLQICYPVFGTSKYLVVGPVAVMSLMSRFAIERLEGNQVEEFSREWVGLMCVISILVSMFQLTAGYFSMGTHVAKIFPECIVSSFSCAAALIIASTQLSGLLGISKCNSSEGKSCGFVSTVSHTLLQLSAADFTSCLVGVCSIALLLCFKHVASYKTGSLVPKLGSLSVVVGSVFMVLTLGPDYISTMALVGDIPSGLPSPRWFMFNISFPQLCQLFVSSAPIALVGYAEAIAIAKTTDNDSVNENRELIALGFCNAFTAWVGGYPVTGSFSRTAINAECGARSPLSTAIAAFVVVLVLLFSTSFLALLPKPAVSAIVLVAVFRLINVGEFRKLLLLWNTHRNPIVFVYLTTFFVCIIVGVEAGLLLGTVSFGVLSRYKPMILPNQK